jgi:hypothetical protein
MPGWGKHLVATVVAGRALLVAAASIMAPAAAEADIPERTKELMLQAVEDRICYESFWDWDSSFQSGKLVGVSMLYANGHGYVWARDLTADKMTPGVTTLFRVGVRAGKSAVTLYISDFNIADPVIFDIVKRIGREIPSEPEVTGFLVPRWCATPHFDPSTLWKEKAVAKIAEKVSEESRKLAKAGDPKSVEIVIGDFNFDYPKTAIYIPSLKKLMFAHLRDDEHPAHHPLGWLRNNCREVGWSRMHSNA